MACNVGYVTLDTSSDQYLGDGLAWTIFRKLIYFHNYDEEARREWSPLYAAQAKGLAEVLCELCNEAAATYQHPVGYVIINTTGNDPGTELGYGTWEKIAAGRVLIGQDTGDADFDVLEETGGSKTHSHTVNGHVHAMPHTHDIDSHTHAMSHTHDASEHKHQFSHVHAMAAHSHTIQAHFHGLNNHRHSGPSHSHTLSAHYHTGPSHTHTLSAHTHNGPAHVHGMAGHQHLGGAHTHSLNSHTHPGGSHTHSLNSHTHTATGHTHGMASHAHSVPTHRHLMPFSFTGISLQLHGGYSTGASSNRIAYWEGDTTVGPSYAQIYTEYSGTIGTGGPSPSSTDSGGALATSGPTPSTTGSGGTGDTGIPSPNNTGSGGEEYTGVANPADTDSAGTGATSGPSADYTGYGGAGTTGTPVPDSTSSDGTGDTGLPDPDTTGAAGDGDTGITGDDPALYTSQPLVGEITWPWTDNAEAFDTTDADPNVTSGTPLTTGQPSANDTSSAAPGTGTASSVQPYYVVTFWKRVA